MNRRPIIILAWVLMLLSTVAVPVGAVLLVGAYSGQSLWGPLRVFLLPLMKLAAVGVLVALIVYFVMRRLGPERLAAIREGQKAWRWWPLAVQGAVIVVFGLVITISFGPIMALEMVWMLPMFAGFGVISAAARRMGEEVYCAGCGYEQPGEAVAADESEDRCPECGAYWRRRGGSVVGRRHIHKGLIALGVVLIMVGLGWNFLRIPFPELSRVPLAVVPTGMLIGAVVDAEHSKKEAFEALAARTLSRDQDLRLMEGLLEKRKRGEGLFGNERAWLETAFTAGRMPPELIERFFADEVEVSIDAPAQARVGEQVSIGLHVRHRGMNGGTVHDMFVAFGGYIVDGDEPAARQDGPIHASLLGRVRPSFGRDRGPVPGGNNPGMGVVPENPGPLRVRAVMWVYAVPGRSGGAFTWNADGTPALPAATMWRERVEIEHVIDMRP